MFCQTIKGQKISLFSQGTNVNYYHEKELPFTNCNRNRKFSLSCGGLPRVPVNNNNNKPKSTSRTQWKYNVLLHWMVPWSTSLKESKPKNHENRVTDLVVFPSDPLSAYRAMFLHIPAFQLNDPKLWNTLCRNPVVKWKTQGRISYYPSFKTKYFLPWSILAFSWKKCSRNLQLLREFRLQNLYIIWI